MRSLWTSYMDTTITYSAEGSHEMCTPLTSGDCGSAEGCWRCRFGGGEETPYSPLESCLATVLTRQAAVNDMKCFLSAAGPATRLGICVRLGRDTDGPPSRITKLS